MNTMTYSGGQEGDYLTFDQNRGGGRIHYSNNAADAGAAGYTEEDEVGVTLTSAMVTSSGRGGGEGRQVPSSSSGGQMGGGSNMQASYHKYNAENMNYRR